MASNHTSNYNLNQWSENDRVLRTDFNADNAKIDTALGSLASAVNGKAPAGQVDSLQSAVSALQTGKADQSALDSLKSTVTKHTASLLGKGNCQVYLTSYTGTGSYGSANLNSLSFPSRPIMVFITNSVYRLFLFQGVRGTWSETSAGPEGNVHATWQGRSVQWYCPDSSRAQLNLPSAYSVVAFLDAEG